MIMIAAMLMASHASYVSCDYFAMERWQLDHIHRSSMDTGSFDIFTVIEGAARLYDVSGISTLARGESIILPASLGAYSLEPQDQTTLLRCYVPV